jgi:hypothetical protein
MTQIVADLGELGPVGATLHPIDLPLLRNGATWDLTGYGLDGTTPIRVWPLRTREALATTLGTTQIRAPATDGIVRWTPVNQTFPESGIYEARLYLVAPDLESEASGLFRFSIAAQPT